MPLIWLMLLASDLPSAESLQSAALAARKRIISGDIRYEIAFGKPPKSMEEPLEWTPPRLRDRLVFDQKPEFYAYLDRWMPNERTAVLHGKVMSWKHPDGGSTDRIILRPDFVYQWNPDRLEDGTVMGIGENLASDNPREFRLVFHPWKFGLMPTIIDEFFDTELEAYVAAPTQRTVEVREETLNGVPCYCVVAAQQGGVTVSTWYDPTKAFNVVRVTATGTNQVGVDYVTTVDSELQYHPEADVWYPRQTIHASGINGKPPSTAERVLFTEVKLNIPIDPEQFTVKALQAPPHTGIARSYDKPGFSEEWTGEKVDIVRRPARPATPPTKPVDETAAVYDDSRRARRYWLMAGGFLLGNALLLWAVFAWNPMRAPAVTTNAHPPLKDSEANS